MSEKLSPGHCQCKVSTGDCAKLGTKILGPFIPNGLKHFWFNLCWPNRIIRHIIIGRVKRIWYFFFSSPEMSTCHHFVFPLVSFLSILVYFPPDVCLFICFERRSHYVVQTGFKMPGSKDPLSSAFLGARIPGTSHCF